MKVTYLRHSGFVVEYAELVLIFDYYKGTLPDFSADKKIYVFVSHRHHDHFQKTIFEWKERYPDIKYILSDDIEEKGPEGCTCYIGPREKITVDDLGIQTFRSTDEGVAFLIEGKGKVLYHAGDLNWWHWEEESDVYNEMMRRKYQHEIGKIGYDGIDIAFVPLDPRQEKQELWGLDYFMKHTNTERVFPMHMWDRYEVYDRLMNDPQAESYRDRVMHITGPQQIFEWEDEI